MGYSLYWLGSHRWGGYGVTATCDHPKCNKEIHRGVSYVCGGEPGAGRGCGLYFCEEHLTYRNFNTGDAERETVQVCERCATQRKRKPFDPKQEHQDWIKHLLTDPSWEEWRKNNPSEVKLLFKQKKYTYEKGSK